MEKIKTFFRRLRGMSLKKMWRIVQQVHQESKKASILIFLDMVYYLCCRSLWCGISGLSGFWLCPHSWKEKPENLYDHERQLGSCPCHE